MSVEKGSRALCHTPFQHYEMFHGQKRCGCGGWDGPSLWGAVFNKGHRCCCNSGDGFLTGVGIGIGEAITNFLFGGMNNGWNWGCSWGNWSWNSGWGGGWSSFGNWGWGGGGGGSTARSSSRAKKDSDDSSSSVSSRRHKCKDKDQPKITELTTELKDIKNAGDARALNKKLDELIAKPLDSAHETDNIKQYKALKALLVKNAKDNGWNLDENAAPVVPKAQPQQVIAPKPTEVVPMQEAVADDNKIKIGDTELNLKDLTLDKLTPDLINKIKDSGTANKILKALNALTADGNGIKVSTNYKMLLLASKSNLPMHAGHNTKLSGEDAYVRGTVSEVTEPDQNKNITFNITTEKGTYKFHCKEDDHDIILKKVVNSDYYKLSPKFPDGVTYTFTPNDEYAIREGAPALVEK